MARKGTTEQVTFQYELEWNRVRGTPRSGRRTLQVQETTSSEAHVGTCQVFWRDYEEGILGAEGVRGKAAGDEVREEESNSQIFRALQVSTKAGS